MQYFGGKAKIAKYIVPYLESVRKENQIYLEPFVGGANVVSQMSGKRFASDYNEYLIEMYKGVQNGYELPNEISEEEYKYIKENKNENKALTGFVGFGCSFAGKWFGGYARNKQNHNYCLASKNSLIKKMNNMGDVKFAYKNYLDLKPNSCLIYCDPPYKNTTKYTGTPDFNTELFWDIMRNWSKNNDVYISEYEAPTDFECVLEVDTKTNIRDKNNNVINRTEKLFKYINK
jgi:DNA adenine methylase